MSLGPGGEYLPEKVEFRAKVVIRFGQADGDHALTVVADSWVGQGLRDFADAVRGRVVGATQRDGVLTLRFRRREEEA